MTCPKCGGEADNGFDRGYPQTPYLCKRCSDMSVTEQDYSVILDAMKDDDCVSGCQSANFYAGHLATLIPKYVELQDKLFILEENYRMLYHYAFRSNCLSGADNFKAYKDGKDE